MRTPSSVALVSGADRGIGRHFATQLLARGAAKVYATARSPERVDIPGAHVLPLDITDPASSAAAAAAAPVLATNGGGAILNVLSALSWFSYDGANAHAAAKSAEWSLTNGVRLELAAQGTLVTGVHLGAADTDMMAGYDGQMVDPADVARAALDGIEAGRIEVLVDEWSAMVKATLADDPSVFYAEAVPTG